VLRDDNLKLYVLQYAEDFIKLALERGGAPRGGDAVPEGGVRGARRAAVRPRTKSSRR
jgi:hypothetical protein